jgi:hypothetical protein
MDTDKFKALANLVREAKQADADAFKLMEAAKAEWKKTNEVLTDRMKVFDEFVNSQKAEAISL